MAILSEQKLSNRIRIQLIERIAEIDLPWFLFLEIDAALSMLNYFKLSNLQRNADIFFTYLDELSCEYNHHVEKISERYRASEISHFGESWGFLTDYLISKNCTLKLPQKRLIAIESEYRVRCLLRMKEFINRRIYNEHSSVSRVDVKLRKKS